jgi:hypothetical protein
MNTILRCSLLVLAAICALPATAATTSVNGSNIFAEPSIIDAQGNTWTIVAGVIEKNGVHVGNNYNVNLLLEYNAVFYQRNTSSNWYEWTGSSWSSVSDPRIISTSGANVKMGSNILVDSEKHVWTLASNGYGYLDGNRAEGNYDTTLLLYYKTVVYCVNSSQEWYSWSGSSWVRISGDPRGASLGLVQYNSYTSPACPASNINCTPEMVGNSSVTFATATTKGHAIWVAATVSDYAGAHSITVTDSQHNTYHQLNQVNDGSPGYQSLAQFYAADIAGGSDTVTVDWSYDNYKGVVVAEVGGMTAAPLVGNNARIQDGNIAAGSNNVNSNNISAGAAEMPARIMSITMDTDGGGSDIGGTGYCAVASGTGFTQIAQVWSWAAVGQPACYLATVETMTVSAAGNVTGSFTTTHRSDPYVTAAAVFH